MGIFGPSSGSSKIDLIRLLLIQRISNDPEAKKQGYSPFMVRQMPDTQVVGTIEAGIVSIVETFTSLSLKGVADEEAILMIERHRMSLGRRELPQSLTLRSYVLHRVAIEHTGADLPIGHTEVCTEAAEHFFAYRDDKGEAAHSIKHALLEKRTAKLERILTILANYFGGEITEDLFFEVLENDVLAWQIELTERQKKAAQGAFMMHLRNLE